MKKILASFFTLLAMSSIVQAQEDVFQLTFKIPDASKSNVVGIFVKPVSERTGQISTMQFAISIPASATPIPTATITSSITGLSFAAPLVSTETAEGASYTNFTFLGDGNATVPSTTYTAGTEYKIAEVAFTGGPIDLVSARLSAYPEGGTNLQSYFYMAIGGTQVVNTPSQFYGTGAVNKGFGTEYSYYSIGDVSLPVKFLSFYALKSGSDAKLTWTVENDADNKYFDIERSADGRTYAPFTRINALNNGKSVNTYEIADNGSLSSSLVYYRIKQVDKNGNTTYSLIRNLKLDKSAAISLYPNPARTVTKLVFDAEAAGKASVTIRDVAGKQVQQLNIQLVKGINQQTLNVHTLPAGEYNVTIIGTNLKETIKLSRVN